MKDIQLNIEDGQVTILVLLNFSQAFDMVTHGLLLCKLKNLQNYKDGAWMLVDSYLSGRTQFVKCVDEYFVVDILHSQRTFKYLNAKESA
jgi:hypothetical protein